MKKIISVCLAVMMLLSAVTVTSLAAKNDNAYGDLNGDNDVTAADALLVLQHAVGKITIDKDKQVYADVDGKDGVSAADALLVLQFAVGKISKLPTFEINTRDLVIELPETQIDNGAYVYDTTADNSFEITTEGLAEKTIYLFTTGAYRNTNAIVTKDNARFVYSLQGLINRDFGNTHTSLLYANVETSDKTWLDYMMEKGNFYNGYTIVEIKTFAEFMSTFKAQIEQCGIVLWDPDVPSTANVAQTICGLDGYLPLQYNTDSRSFYSKLMTYTEAENGGYKLDIKQNLCGLFENAKVGTKITGTDIDSTGSSKCDAYYWALEKYMSRCTSKYLAYIVDGAVSVDGNPLAKLSDAAGVGSTCLPNMDYLVARRCFFFDLTCYPSEAPCDDKEQELGTDAKTMNAILKAAYDRNGGEVIQMMGFPPWWLKYTTHQNLGSLVATTLEWMTVEVMTAYNCAKEADAAQPCSMTNGSASYKYVSDTAKFENNEPTDTEAYDPDTHYFLYYMGDYDSSAWLKTHMNTFWPDEKRGTLPLMWAFNPNLSFRVPMVFDYVYENASANDYFVAGEGAGYMIPSALYKGHNIYNFSSRTEEDGMLQWINYSKPIYETFDMDITGFIINGNTEVDKKIMSAYNNFSPVGSFTNSPSMKLINHNGTYYVYLQNGIDHNDAALESTVNTMYSFTFGHMKDYNFSAFRTVCASPTQISNITSAYVEYAAAKGKKVKLVDPYTYFRLIKESGQAVNS